MNQHDVKAALERSVEQLAAIEHERWAHWQRHIHEQGKRLEDGSLVLPAELVRRWERQIITRYADLSDVEKASDREQVRRYLPVIVAALRERSVDNTKSV